MNNALLLADANSEMTHVIWHCEDVNGFVVMEAFEAINRIGILTTLLTRASECARVANTLLYPSPE